MKILDRSMTARDAANHFAANYSEEPRKVGCIVTAPNYGILFQFVDGRRWYSVQMVDGGWEVVPEDGRA